MTRVKPDDSKRGQMGKEMLELLAGIRVRIMLCGGSSDLVVDALRNTCIQAAAVLPLFGLTMVDGWTVEKDLLFSVRLAVEVGGLDAEVLEKLEQTDWPDVLSGVSDG